MLSVLGNLEDVPYRQDHRHILRHDAQSDLEGPLK